MDQPERRTRIAALVEGLLRNPHPDGRRAFSIVCFRYAKTYLRAIWRGRSAGFNGGFKEAVTGAAGMTISLLLRPKVDPYRLPHLERELASTCLKMGAWRVPPPAPGGDWSSFLGAANDLELETNLKLLLRLKLRQAMHREWSQVNPEKGKIWRTIKRRVSRSPHLEIHEDARGWFLGKKDMNLRKPALSYDSIVDALGRGCSSLADALDVLVDVFRNTNGHGGYCVLGDVVDVYFELIGQKLAFEGNGTGFPPNGLGIHLTGSGLPDPLFVERVRHLVAGFADKFLDHDEKRPAAELDPEWRERIAVVVVEMVCRKFEMGRPEWRHLSQKELASFLIPELHNGDYEEFCRNRIDYAVRRVRRELKKALRRERGENG